MLTSLPAVWPAGRRIAAQYRLLAIYSNFIGRFEKILRHGQRTMILLDPSRFLNRLEVGLIFDPARG
jgi:hypothetical protein